VSATPDPAGAARRRPDVTHLVVDDALRAELGRLAAVPSLLVASDYDGTLAELVDDPALAHPDPTAIDAMSRLAALAHTEVAIVSGRSLHDLEQLTGLRGVAHLVGSHGSEFEPGVVSGVREGDLAVLDRARSMVEAIAARAPAARVEAKPASVAFHTREVDPDLVPALVDAVATGPGSLAGISVKRGKDVIELTVTDATKGSALALLREQLGVVAVLFVGDDLTDEDAFTALHPGDVGVKVGPGATMADHRVPDVRTVAELLHALARLRADT